MVRFVSTYAAAILALASFASSAAVPGSCKTSGKASTAGVSTGQASTGHVPAAQASTGEVFNGDTTWYGKDCGEEECWQKGACAFVDYTLPATIDGSTCVSEAIWNSSYHCGACVEITYQGKKKIAMVRESL